MGIGSTASFVLWFVQPMSGFYSLYLHVNIMPTPRGILKVA
jgi:hypothetical protein